MSERKLARLVRIDDVRPVPDADLLEVAQVGGWPVVVPKGDFATGDVAVYFEIDSFLPEGNPAWQFLVDKSSREFNGMRGHVLRSVKLRGQVSQGLLLRTSAFPGIDFSGVALGEDLSERLGIVKYEAPVPASLAGLVRGEFPSSVPKTDQQRIQNLADELSAWRKEADKWEVTEKLEGSSCTFAWLGGELHVCSRNLDLAESEKNSFWRVAKELGIAEKLAAEFGNRDVALQGELVGHGIEGNIYRIQGKQYFYLYDVVEVSTRSYWPSAERRALADKLGIPHVPVIDEAFVLDESVSMESLLAMADGKSRLLATQNREGLVFKRQDGKASFKAISNAYLLKQK